MSELGKLDKKIKKTLNQSQKAASGNKKTTNEKCQSDSNKKLGLEWTMNGLGQLRRKNPIKKTEKNQ